MAHLPARLPAAEAPDEQDVADRFWAEVEAQD